MAARTGLSKPTVGRIWELGPRLHLQDSVKLSTDPFYGREGRRSQRSAPQAAGEATARADEKSRSQALDRSQTVPPVLPALPGRSHARLPAAQHHQPVRRVRHVVREWTAATAPSSVASSWSPLTTPCPAVWT